MNNKYFCITFFILLVIVYINGQPQLINSSFQNYLTIDKTGVCSQTISLLFSYNRTLSTNDFKNLNGKGIYSRIYYQNAIQTDIGHQLFFMNLDLFPVSNMFYTFTVDGSVIELGTISCVMSNLPLLSNPIIYDTVYDTPTASLFTVIQFNAITESNFLICVTDSYLTCSVNRFGLKNPQLYTIQLAITEKYLTTILPSSFNVKITLDLESVNVTIPNRYPFNQVRTTITNSLTFVPEVIQGLIAYSPLDTLESITYIEATNYNSLYMVSPDGVNSYPIQVGTKNSTFSSFLFSAPAQQNTLEVYMCSKNANRIMSQTINYQEQFKPNSEPIMSSTFDSITNSNLLDITMPISYLDRYILSVDGLVGMVTQIPPVVPSSKISFNYNFKYTIPILNEFNGYINIQYKPYNYSSFEFINNTQLPAIYINKIEAISVTDRYNLFMFNITSKYPIVKICLDNKVNATYDSLVNISLNTSIFEFLVPKIFLKPFQIVVYDASSSWIAIFSDQAYNTQFMKFNYDYKLSTSILDATDFASLRFSQNSFSFYSVNKTVIIKEIPVSLYFRLNYNIDILNIRLLMYNSATNFIFNSTTGEYQADFKLYSDFIPGEVPYFIQDLNNLFRINSTTLISMYGQIANISISDNYGDMLSPMLVDIAQIPGNSIINNGANVTIGWSFTIKDYPNGFGSGSVNIISDINVQPTVISFNSNNLVSGDKYYGVYNISIVIPNYRTQTYRLKNLFLKQDGSNTPSSMVDQLNSMIGTIKAKKTQIEVVCNATLDTVPPQLTDFSFTPNYVDVGSFRRTVTFNVTVTDGVAGSGIYTSMGPVVMVTPDVGEVITVRLNHKRTYWNGTQYLSEFFGVPLLPFGYGVRTLLVSIYSIMDNSMNPMAYTASDLKSNGFPYFIPRSFNADEPIISSGFPVNRMGGALSLTGKSFGSSSEHTQVFVDLLDSKGYRTYNISFISSTYIRTVDIDATNSASVMVKVKNLINSKESVPLMIKTYIPYIKPTPTPTPTKQPGSLCPGTPPCNNRGQCKENGCICQYPWYGPSCSSEIIIIPPPGPQKEPTIGTNVTNGGSSEITSMIQVLEIREITSTDDIVKIHEILKWNFYDLTNDNSSKIYLYSAQLNETNTIINVTVGFYMEQTNITFGNQQLDIKPSSIKYSIKLSKYEFQQSTNFLQVVLEAAIQSKDSSACSSKQFGSKTDSKDDVQWIKMNIDQKSLYGRFIDFGIVDNRITNITNRIIDDDDKNSNQFRSVKVGITVPFYESSIYLDPDFSNLIDVDTDGSAEFLCHSKKKLSNGAIAGIIVGSVIFVSFIIGGAIFLSVKFRNRKENIKLESRLKRVET